MHTARARERANTSMLCASLKNVFSFIYFAAIKASRSQQHLLKVSAGTTFIIGNKFKKFSKCGRERFLGVTPVHYRVRHIRYRFILINWHKLSRPDDGVVDKAVLG